VACDLRLHVATIDHIILKVNDLGASVRFYTSILGFTDEGRDGPFTVLRIGPACQMQLAPWGTTGGEHYAFEVTPAEFHEIFTRLKAAKVSFGPTYHSVGTDTGPGSESGARGVAPTVYFNDPNGHLLEIRSYSTPTVHP
jgi:catechol 2,3-dioxygenase-like lactoylglutathione lyase family enzyme